jgi:hypothetical protein
VQLDIFCRSIEQGLGVNHILKLLVLFPLTIVHVVNAFFLLLERMSGKVDVMGNVPRRGVPLFRETLGEQLIPSAYYSPSSHLHTSLVAESSPNFIVFFSSSSFHSSKSCWPGLGTLQIASIRVGKARVSQALLLYCVVLHRFNANHMFIYPLH